MEKSEIREMLANVGINEGDRAFREAMPAGQVTLVKFPKASDVREYEGTSWYPVSFKSSVNGEVYDVSLKGLLQAPGLKFKSLDLDDRGLALAEMVGKKFDYLGKQPKQCTLKKDTTVNWRDEEGNEHVAHKGDKFLLWQHSFKEKVVG